MRSESSHNEYAVDLKEGAHVFSFTKHHLKMCRYNGSEIMWYLQVNTSSDSWDVRNWNQYKSQVNKYVSYQSRSCQRIYCKIYWNRAQKNIKMHPMRSRNLMEVRPFLQEIFPLALTKPLTKGIWNIATIDLDVYNGDRDFNNKTDQKS